MKGPFPDGMVTRGKNSSKFFDSKGELQRNRQSRFNFKPHEVVGLKKVLTIDDPDFIDFIDVSAAPC